MTERVDDIALAVALVALVVTFSQLVAQLFSTAEGYRRCQESVIGEWSQYSYRRWRETQWRFETIVVTPEFLLAPYSPKSSEQVDLYPDEKNDSQLQLPESTEVVDISAVESAQTTSKKHDSILHMVPRRALSFIRRIYEKSTSSIRHKRIPEGNELLLHKSFAEKHQKDPKSELVCWIALLQQLHHYSKQCTRDVVENADFSSWEKGLLPPKEKSSSTTGSTTWPAIRFKQRSWDFMPADVVRPFASTTLSDIAILALRMGMAWQTFEPSKDKLEAEGDQYILTSITIMGLGILLQFKATARNPGQSEHMQRQRFGVEDYTGTKRERRVHRAVHRADSAARRQVRTQPEKPKSSLEMTSHIVYTPEADRMWFGILVGNPDIEDLRDLEFHIGTLDDVYQTMDALDPTKQATACLRNMDPKDVLFGFHDIIPMVAPWMRQPHSRINRVPKVAPSVIGSTFFHARFLVFHARLQAHPNPTSDMREVLKRWDRLRVWNPEWDGISPNPDLRPLEFLDLVEECYHQTTVYFHKIQARLPYLDLVKAHLSRAPFAKEDAQARIRQKDPNADFRRNRPAVPNVDEMNNWGPESMHVYWDYVKHHQKTLKGQVHAEPELVEEAWVMLMFRAFLWQRGHQFHHRQNPLPAVYYGSQMPVYIG